jgi:O-antigen ligase
LWAFASGGILGLGVFVSMIYRALARGRRLLRHNAELVFPLMMLVLTVVAALGAPSFTINRASTVFWTLYPLATIVGLSQRPRGTTPADSTVG